MKRVTLLVVAVIVLVLGIGMTAKAASLKSENSQFSKEQYQAMEEKFVEEVRLVLLEKGCKNAGVTLTYIADAEGNREYTVAVHHTKLEKMSGQELVLLQERMQEIAQEKLFADIKLKQI